MYQQYPSLLLENAVNELSRLPGIGKKSALRLALYLLRQDVADVARFTDTISAFRNEIKYCKCCFNISDRDLCSICAGDKRNRRIICVVETIRDVMAIENTGQFQGIYHVLGGVISPMDGVSPDDLNINELEKKVADGEADEIVFALSATLEGDTTNYFIFKKLSQFPVKITTISRGIAVGDELQYTDEITLGRSLLNRIPFEKTLK
ncbi:MAG: recombination mediator RecR [Marinilabiliaceae bacterium]|nr:recombination mediator RecR [Marinilabiliaceae bacterium]